MNMKSDVSDYKYTGGMTEYGGRYDPKYVQLGSYRVTPSLPNNFAVLRAMCGVALS